MFYVPADATEKRFKVEAVDALGNLSKGPFTWTSSDSAIFTVQNPSGDTTSIGVTPKGPVGTSANLQVTDGNGHTASAVVEISMGAIVSTTIKEA